MENIIGSHENTFEGGLNTDLTKNLQNPNQYLDARNMMLVNTNNFLSLHNIKGTTVLNEISTYADTVILGAFPIKFKVGSTGTIDALLIMSYEVVSTVPKLFIRVQNTSTTTLYTMYSETVGADYLDEERSIDGFLYPEASLDIVYFTDNYNPLRKFRCEILDADIAAATAGTPVLDSLDLELLKRRALGKITLDSITTGGSLLTGTYQLAYQLYNEDSNKTSAFSLLTNPIHIYYEDAAGIPSAAYGLSTNKKIVVDITLTEAEEAYYTHFRIAVIENIGTVDTAQSTVGVTPWEVIANVANYSVLSNTQYQFTTLEDIVIDLAAIETVKTVTTRDQRLIAGNIAFTPLEYDNGTPAVTSGSVLKENGSSVSGGNVNIAKEDVGMSLYKGYFRDEVYRFAISYFDEHGNFSYPKTLDLKGGGGSPIITGNQISAGNVDIKFPKRSTYESATYYSIMDGDQKFVNLGLRLTDITGHPTWAKGYVILRAKRKKNILFQTPIVPMVRLYGLGAVGQYPTIYEDQTGTSVTDDTLTPPGPASTFVPYNMFHGAPTQPSGYVSVAGGSSLTQQVVGESKELKYIDNPEYVLLFPPSYIYNNEPLLFTGAESLKTVDAVKCVLKFNQLNDQAYVDAYAYDGIRADTRCSGTFYALADTDHYFENTHAGSRTPSVFNQNIQIKEALVFDNYDEPKTFNGESFNDYDKLKVVGASFGTKPNAHKYAIVKHATTMTTGKSVPSGSGWSPTLKTTETGVISTISISNAGSGYSSGVVNLTGGTGTGATANITTVGSGAIINIAIVERGSGYTVSDVLTVSGGSGGTVTVTAITNGFTPTSNRFLNTSGNTVNTLEIANVVRGLEDNRYGDVDGYNEFIYTGTKVVFSDSEVATYISQGDPLPGGVNVDVWGGDCVVSPHFFKVSDTTYGMVAQEKFVNIPEGSRYNADTAGRNFGKAWSVGSAGTDAPVAMPIFYEKAAQYIMVPLESEFNGSVVDMSNNDVAGTTAGGHQYFGADILARASAPRSYNYNMNLNKENDQKVFVPRDPLTDAANTYPARAFYSDIKIYNTEIEGFDTIRTNSYLDLNEAYRGITKLDRVGDRLYAVQESAIAVIPVGERVIETTDTTQLAVRSGEFLSNPLYIDTLRGSKDLSTFKSTGNSLFFLDRDNRAVYKLGESGLSVISGNGITSYLRTVLPNLESDLGHEFVSVYNPLYDQYWIGSKSAPFCFVWNDGLQRWEGQLQFPLNSLGAGVYTDNKLFLIGKDVTLGTINVETMFTGVYNNFMGTLVTPFVQFVAAPMKQMSKVFDAVLVNSSGTPLSGQITAEALGVSATGAFTPFISQRGEGNWKAKVMYASGNKRVRGPYGIVQVNFPTTDVAVNISSVLTKYRPSFNTF